MEKENDYLPRFDVHGEPSGLAEKWKRWFRAFELYVVGKGIKDNDRKHALFGWHGSAGCILYFAGRRGSKRLC